ncbi:MAG: hypothetical protein ACI97A_003757 [Planctomycetota bacterium]|jgi:hypothetical protein
MRRSSFSLSLCIALIAMTSTPVFAQADPPTTLTWLNDHALAVKEAETSQRPIMIYVFDSV